MIDWIDKLPDSLTGVVMAGAVWFGANYAFLAERAIAKAQAVSAPSCIDVIDRHQRGLDLPPSGIGAMVGIPQLDIIERNTVKLLKPRLLAEQEKKDLCACAAKTAARNLRFDYAVHTASFRIIEPQSVANLSASTIGTLTSGVCGALPQLRKLG